MTLKGHTDSVRSVAFSPDGDTIASEAMIKQSSFGTFVQKSVSKH